HLEELFPEHFEPSVGIGDVLDVAVVVLDTNVILDLERLTGEARADALRILRKLEDQLFFPHQVMDEYLRQRKAVVGETRSLFETVTSSLTGADKQVRTALSEN